MSRLSVARVRESYEAWNAGDLERIKDGFAADAEIVPYLAPMLSRPRYTGRTGIDEWFASTFEPWESFGCEIDDVVDGGDRMVVSIRLVATGKGSDVEIDQHIAHALRVSDDGHILELTGFASVEDAVRAAGLPRRAATTA